MDSTIVLAIDLAIVLAGVETQSIVDGPGLRYTIFTQGCPHRCVGCHNPDTWEMKGGTKTKISTLLTEIKKNPLLQGITFSGGEPLIQAEALLPLAKAVTEMGKDIVCFTGYTLEELLILKEKDQALADLLPLLDILIDGRFELDQKDLRLQFRGSHNQRVLDLPRSLEENKPIILEKYM